MPSDVENIRQIRSDYIATLAAEAAYQLANGPKPSYSIDGESVSWDSWRDSMTAKIESLTKLLNTVGGPFLIRSRGKA